MSEEEKLKKTAEEARKAVKKAWETDDALDKAEAERKLANAKAGKEALEKKKK